MISVLEVSKSLKEVIGAKKYNGSDPAVALPAVESLACESVQGPCGPSVLRPQAENHHHSEERTCPDFLLLFIFL